MGKPEKIEFGIVQGRLIQSPNGILQHFPQEYWESEFFLASSLGLNFIEIIAERQHNENNPIWTEEGVKKIIKLCKINNLSLPTLCNDYIIDHSLLEIENGYRQSLNLISRAKLMGIKQLILPLFEKSELTENNMDHYKDILIDIADITENNDIVLYIETSINANSLYKFLKLLNHPNIKCVFDTGNRIAYGHNIYSDIILLKDYIGHVHIKDKDKYKNNVLLGVGIVDFYKVFQSFKSIGYRGSYTFETYRGSDPVRTVRYNLLFTNFFMKEVSIYEN